VPGRSELQVQWNAVSLYSSQQCQSATQAVAIQQQLGDWCANEVTHTPAADRDAGGEAAMFAEPLLNDNVARQQRHRLTDSCNNHSGTTSSQTLQ